MDFSIDKWQEICSDLDSMEIEFFGEFNCDFQDLTEDNLHTTRSKEAAITTWFYRLTEMFGRTKNMTLAAGRKIEELNTSRLKEQEKVITLQEELLKEKDAQIASFQTTVRDEVASVNTAVKSEIRSSWSKVVELGTAKPISTANLKEAVKSAVAEDDKSRNIMIFGKAEAENENVGEVVAEVLNDLNEKPRPIECLRVGTTTEGKPRPIKVKLSSRDSVANILRKAKLLRDSSYNRATFIGPDRSKEERIAHKSLVEKMKLKIKEEPKNYHYILRGMIISVMKK